MPFNNSRGVKSIEVGTRLLRILADAGRPMMLKELAQAAGLAPAQVHTYLASFRRAKLVEQDGIAGMYRLGPFAIRLAQAHMHSDPALHATITGARELADATGLETNVLVWIGGRPIVIDVREGLNNLNVDVKTGLAFSLFKTATGRIFVAFSRRSEVVRCLDADILAAVAEGFGNRADLERVYWAEIETVRKNGYAMSVDMPVPGVSALAAPVIGPQGEVDAVVVLAGPKALIDVSPDGQTARALLSLCRRVSSQTSQKPIAAEPA